MQKLNPAAADPLAEGTVGGTIRSVAEPAGEVTLGPRPRHDRQVLIGRGGMGEVWRAWDPRLRRSVALKRARADRPGRADRRFLLEAEVTAQLQHPGILPVYEVGTEPDGAPFFTMREVKGRPLSGVLRELPLVRLVGILIRVSEAMAYAHHEGVVHRDLKPANIMVGDFGEVLVLDWGLARRHGEAPPAAEVERPEGEAGQTRAGAALGTWGYMPPEQARGDHAAVGPRSDLFALGAILFQLCVGRPPFTDREDTLRCQPTIPATVPRELAAVLERALAPHPAGRFESAEAFGEELQAWLDGRPLQSLRYSRMDRLGLWARRHRTVLSAVGLVLGASALMGLLGIFKYVRDTEAEATLARAAEAEARSALADSELAQGQALVAAGLWDEARAPLRRARDQLEEIGRSTIPADLSLWYTLARSPPADARGSSWPELERGGRVEWGANEFAAATLIRPGKPPLAFPGAFALWFDPRWAIPTPLQGETWLWSLETDRPVRRVCAGHCRGWASADGAQLAFYDEGERRLHAEDLVTGAPLWSRPLPDAQVVTWTEDSLVVGGDLPALYVLDRQDGHERLRLGGHHAPVRDLQVHEGRLLSRDTAGSVLGWALPLRSPALFRTPSPIHGYAIAGDQLVTVGGSRLSFFNLSTREPGRDEALPTEGFTGVALTTEAAWLIHPALGRWLRVDLEGGAPRWVEKERDNLWGFGVGDALLLTWKDGLRLGLPGEAPRWVQPGVTSGTVWDRVVHDGALYVACQVPPQALRLDLQTGAELGRVALPSKPYSVSVAPDGTAACALADGTIALLRAGETRILPGHQGLVADVAFDADGGLLASVSFDRTLRLWDPVTGRELARQSFDDPVLVLHNLGPRRWLVGDERDHLWELDLDLDRRSSPAVVGVEAPP